MQHRYEQICNVLEDRRIGLDPSKFSACPVCMQSKHKLLLRYGTRLHTVGHKQQLQWFRSYVAAVLSTPGHQDLPPTYLLQVFDLRNKLIAMSIPLTEVCPAWLLIILSLCALHVLMCMRPAMCMRLSICFLMLVAAFSSGAQIHVWLLMPPT